MYIYLYILYTYLYMCVYISIYVCLFILLCVNTIRNFNLTLNKNFRRFVKEGDFEFFRSFIADSAEMFSDL